MKKNTEAHRRYKRVLKMRNKGLSFQAIADELKVSKTRAWQIYRAADKWTRLINR